jgi:hypothetical protein
MGRLMVAAAGRGERILLELARLMPARTRLNENDHRTAA